jgi:hypothetical protein
MEFCNGQCFLLTVYINYVFVTMNMLPESILFAADAIVIISNKTVSFCVQW